MKWVPQSLGGRLLLAFVTAAVAIAVLAITVRQRDAVRAAVRRADALPLLPPPPALGLQLAPCGGHVLLASRIEAVPPDVAPVVQLFTDGTAVLRRPAPLALSPQGPTDGDAALLLPDRSLCRLAPAARAALLDLIGQLLRQRPVPTDRVVVGDLVAAPGALAPLLQWVP